MADYWSISKIGIGSTLGLIGLVSLPRGFVFRPPDEDPHPMPWVRVLLSCAIGDRLYPDPQWRRLAAIWRAMYPLVGAAPGDRQRPSPNCEATMPDLVTMLVNHRPARLRGRTLGDVLRSPHLQPAALLARFAAWQADPAQMAKAPPTLAFAVLGQARASGRLSPERESPTASPADHRLGGHQRARNGPRRHPVRRRHVRRAAHDLDRAHAHPQRSLTAI